MTFKLNALVAALVMAASAPALATIEDSSLGNGELFMTVWDEPGQKSYTLDLNVKMNDFLSGIAVSGKSYNYAADANMNSFLSMVAPADKSGLKFAIGAMDGSGATTTDYRRFISTASNIVLGNSLTNQVTNENLKNFAASGDQFLGDTNGAIGSENSLIVTDPALVSYAGSAQWGTNWGSAANFTSTGLIDNDAIVDGGDLGLYFLRQSSGTYAQRNNASIYEGIFQGGNQVYANLDMNGNLTVAAAPIPEADTYAMMLAGLGLIGFMVTRRRVV